MKTPLILAVSVIAWLGVANSHAQSFAIDWFTIDGGGGTSTGGVFTVTGTIGQPDAGAMGGGGFALAGGFWSVFSVAPAPDNVSLSIRRTGPNAMLAWPVSTVGFTLEYTTQLGSGVWTTESTAVVDNAIEHTVTVPTSAVRRFYRLKK